MCYANQIVKEQKKSNIWIEKAMYKEVKILIKKRFNYI